MPHPVDAEPAMRLDLRVACAAILPATWSRRTTISGNRALSGISLVMRVARRIAARSSRLHHQFLGRLAGGGVEAKLAPHQLKSSMHGMQHAARPKLHVDAGRVWLR